MESTGNFAEAVIMAKNSWARPQSNCGLAQENTCVEMEWHQPQPADCSAFNKILQIMQCYTGIVYCDPITVLELVVALTQTLQTYDSGSTMHKIRNCLWSESSFLG